MIPHTQLYLHNPLLNVYGDCQRTVYACLLDLPDPRCVPHFGRGNPTDREFWRRVDLWLADQGLARWRIAFDSTIAISQILTIMGKSNPDTYYMLVGQSRTGSNHVVICLNEAIVHDTGISKPGIIGPYQGFFEVDLLVPLFMRKNL